MSGNMAKAVASVAVCGGAVGIAFAEAGGGVLFGIIGMLVIWHGDW